MTQQNLAPGLPPRPGGPDGPGGSGGRGGPGGPGGPLGPSGRSRRRGADDAAKKVGWRKYVPSWKIVVAVGAFGVLGLFTLVGVGYAMTPVPTATQDGVLAEGSTAYYSNGKTPIMRVGRPREIVTLDKVPEHVQTAVLAAEDRGFWTEPGVSPKGVARAVWNNATGGETQGGSTITQQLARNYYAGLSQERSVNRKFKEVFISIKLGKTKDKKEILQNYLNTISFGRQAEGIQAASRAYFHKTVGRLEVNEAAMLAAMIQRPSYFKTQAPPSDPARRALEDRWNYVLDGMVEMGKLSKADRDQQKFPKTQKEWSDVKDDGQSPYMRQRINQELKDLGISDEAINQRGLKIYTSLDKNWMDAAEAAVKESGPAGLPRNIKIGLVAVDSQSGQIKAFYGGRWSEAYQTDNALQAIPQVGSSFKPYVLATALKKGYSVKSLIDGHSPQNFDNNGDSVPMTQPGYRVSNDEGDPALGVIDLVKATQLSVNTAYVKLGLKLGLADVRRTAEEFGVPKAALDPHEQRAGISLGIASYPAVYQASSYAAFANGGTSVVPHVITKIVDSDGKIYKKLPWDRKKKKVLTPEQAAQATYAMQAVVQGGTGKRAALPDGRPVAGKTGTTEKSAAAWFVGYVPQLSTAVNMFDRYNKPMTNIPGYGGGVYGGQIPASIWKSFMMRVTQGMPVKQFQQPTFQEGQAFQWDTPKPTPTPTPSDKPDFNADRCERPEDFADPRCRDQPPATTTPTSTPTPKPPQCAQFPNLPECRDQQSPGTGTGGNGGTGGTGGGNTTTQSQKLARVPE